MAILSSGDRAAVTAELMQESSTVQESCGLTKAQLRAAVDAADQWASDNAASFNAALPTAARNTLTAPQKARLLRFVIARRYLSGV